MHNDCELNLSDLQMKADDKRGTIGTSYADDEAAAGCKTVGMENHRTELRYFFIPPGTHRTHCLLKSQIFFS